MAVTRAPAVALAAAAALAVACGGTSEKPGARLARPTSVAVVAMKTTKVAGVHPYLAVANAHGDELRLFDAWDDQPVLAPIAFYPLSVPTPLPRPAMVAAVALPVAAGAAAKPDALVVVPTGASELELVDTWSGNPRVVSRLDLAAVAPGASILSVAGAPVAGATPVTDRARLVVGLSGGKLALVEVSRDPAGEAISLGAPALQALGFDPVSLAFAPGDASRLYVASPDPITDSTDGRTVLGAAELDTSAATLPWPVTALDARAPTNAVGAFDVNERAEQDVGTISIDAVTFFDFKVRRVYAALDPSGCGADRPISCGIAVLDPALKGLRTDPSGDAPYAAPFPMPGIASAIVPAGPPAEPATCADPFNPPATPGCLYFSATTSTSQADQRRIFFSPGGTIVPMLPLAPGTGQRWTAAAAAVPASDGATYVVDLSRYGLAPERSFIRGTTRTRAERPGNGPLIENTTVPVSPLIGLDFYPLPADVTAKGTPVPALTSAYVARAIHVTPGYTPTDAWYVIWQGKLPSLDARWGTLSRSGTALVLALQVPNATGPAGSEPFLDVVRVWDPALGVRATDTSPTGAGDLAVVTVPGAAALACGGDGTAPVTFEAPIASLVQPGAANPGGALALTVDPSRCPGLADGGPGIAVNATIRASGLVLVGQSAGYAGRPEFGSMYQLRWADEAALRTACPLVYDDPGAACDAACRLACERLVLARKARRIFYLDDTCPKASADPEGLGRPEADPCLYETVSGVKFPVFPPDMPDPAPGYSFPQPIGAALAFTPVKVEIDATQPYGAKASAADIARDTYLTFSTDQGGAAWMVRKPLSGGSASGSAVPDSAAAYDRSVVPGQAGAGMRFIVTYPDNLVIDFAPGAAVSDVNVIR